MLRKLKKDEIKSIEKQTKIAFSNKSKNEINSYVNNIKQLFEKLVPISIEEFKVLEIDNSDSETPEIITDIWTYQTTYDFTSWTKLPSAWPIAWKNETWHYLPSSWHSWWRSF